MEVDEAIVRSDDTIANCPVQALAAKLTIILF